MVPTSSSVADYSKYIARQPVTKVAVLDSMEECQVPLIESGPTDETALRSPTPQPSAEQGVVEARDTITSSSPMVEGGTPGEIDQNIPKPTDQESRPRHPATPSVGAKLVERYLTATTRWTIWSFLFYNTMLASASTSRVTMNGLLLAVVLMGPMFVVNGSNLSAPLPPRFLVAITLVWNTLMCLAQLVYAAVLSEDNDLHRLVVEEQIWYFEIFGLWDSNTEGRRFLLSLGLEVALCVQAAVFLVARPNLRSGFKFQRHFNSLPVLRWVIATGGCALAQPSYIFCPALFLHMLGVFAFFLPRQGVAKWKLLSFATKSTTLYFIPLLLVVVVWQNASVTIEYPEFGLTRRASLNGRFTDSLLGLLQIWLAFFGSLWSRSLHVDFSRMRDDEVLRLRHEALSESKSTMRLRRRHQKSRLASLLHWAAYFFPLLLLPCLIFVVIIVRTLTSFVYLCIVFAGFVAPLEIFVSCLPLFYVVAALFIMVSYVAAVLQNGVLAESCRVQFYNTETNAFYLMIQALVGMGFAVARVLFRKKPSNKSYTGRQAKLNRIVAALSKEADVLPMIYQEFKQFASSSGDFVSYEQVGRMMEFLTGMSPIESDVKMTWDFFTTGRPLSTKELAQEPELQPFLQSHAYLLPPVHGIGVVEGIKSLEEGSTDPVVPAEANIQDEPHSDERTEAAECPDVGDGVQLQKSRSGIIPEFVQEGLSAARSRIFEPASRLILQPAMNMMEPVQDAGKRAVNTVVNALEMPQEEEEVGSPLDSKKGLQFLDFLVLYHFIKNHRMESAWTLRVVVEFFSQVTRRHTSTFALLAMFVVATYNAHLDALHMAYIVVFVIFLCAPTFCKRYWPLLVGYTILLTASLYAFNLLYPADQGVRAPAYFRNTTIKLDVVGFRPFRTQFELIPYFLLLAFSVAELRLFALGGGGKSFVLVLQEMEWRRASSAPFTLRAQLVFSIFTTMCCFVLVGLLEPRSWLVAGFFMIFAIVILLNTYAPRAAIVVWAIGTLYSVMALLSVSFYQFEVVEALVLNWIDTSSDYCNLASGNLKTCAKEVGFRSAEDSNSSLTLILAPWFLACASNVIQFSLRLQYRSLWVERKESKVDDEYRELLSLLVSRALRLPCEITFKVIDVSREGFKLYQRHSAKIVWLAMIISATWTVCVLDFVYIVLFTFDRRGRTPIVFCGLTMFVVYVYPFYWVPKIPVDDPDFERYLGFSKTDDGKLISQVGPHVLVFVAALMYERAKRLAASSVIAPPPDPWANDPDPDPDVDDNHVSVPMELHTASAPPVVNSTAPAEPLAEDQQTEYHQEGNTNLEQIMLLSDKAYAPTQFELRDPRTRAQARRRQTTIRIAPKVTIVEPNRAKDCDDIEMSLLRHASLVEPTRTHTPIHDESQPPKESNYEPPPREVVLQRFESEPQHSSVTPVEQKTVAEPSQDALTSVQTKSASSSRSVLQHVVITIDFLRNRLFRVLGYELYLLYMLICITITFRRATSVILFIALSTSVLLGQKKFMMNPGYIRVLIIFLAVFLNVAYFMRLGLPAVAVQAPPFNAACSDWWLYLGCSMPISDIVILYLAIGFLRLLKSEDVAFRNEITIVDGYDNLLELLEDRSIELQQLRAMIRSDIDDVLPVLSYDPLRNPRTVADVVVYVFVACFPTSVLAFFHGALVTSVVNMGEMVIGLWLLSFYHDVFWQPYRYWSRVVAFSMFLILVQLVAHLPGVMAWSEQNRGIAMAIGINAWSSGTTTTFSVVIEVAVIWSSFLQRRVFDEFFFTGKLRSFYESSVGALQRHRLMMMFRVELEEEATKLAIEKERSLREKLESVRQSRKGIFNQALAIASAEQQSASSQEDRSSDKALTGSNLSSNDPTTQKKPVLTVVDTEVHFESASSSDFVEVKEETKVEEDSPTTLQSIQVGLLEIVDGTIVWLSKNTYTGQLPNPEYSVPLRFLTALLHFGVRNTQYLCFFAFAMNYIFSPTIWDMGPCLSAVVYALLVLPWPRQFYWNSCLVFNVVGIFLKSILKVVAEQVSLSFYQKRIFSVLFLDLGQTGVLSTADTAFFDIAFDFAVFACLLVHKRVCTRYGVYHETEEDNATLAAKNGEEAAAEQGNTAQEDASPSTLQASFSPRYIRHRRGSSKRQRDSGPGLFSKNTVRDVVTFVSTSKHQLTEHGKLFYSNLMRRFGGGKDFYFLMLALEGIALTFFVLSYYRLSGASVGSFIESVQDDLLPGPLVLQLLLFVVIMVADRIVYVLGALRGKAALHIMLALTYHIGFIAWRFLLPNAPPSAGVVFFSLKYLYLIVSCAQIRNGYPAHRRHDPFTGNATTLYWLGNKIYRLVPFLFELRVLLDWTCTLTTLPLEAWLITEDLHNILYDRFVAIDVHNWSNPKRGKGIPKLVKAYTGLLGFLLVMLVLFFPLMYYSTFNPSLTPNSVSSIGVAMSFGTDSEFFQSKTIGRQLVNPLLPRYIAATRPEVAKFGIADSSKSVQLLNMTECSSELWSISPSSESLVTALVERAIRNESKFKIVLTLDIARKGASSGSPTETQLQQEYEIPYPSLTALQDVLAAGDQPSMYRRSTVINLPRFYSPFIFNRPNTIERFSDVSTADVLDCSLWLNDFVMADQLTRAKYWCMNCSALFTNGNIPNALYPEWDCLAGTASCTPYNYDNVNAAGRSALYFVSMSDEIPSSSGWLPNVGIIALYTTFILALGSMLRTSLTGKAHKLVLTQMADPAPIAELLSFIYLARMMGGEEDLVLEEQLYLELLDLLRSPERVLSMTRFRVDDYDAKGDFQKRFQSATLL
jgi:hypothetical protein